MERIFAAAEGWCNTLFQGPNEPDSFATSLSPLEFTPPIEIGAHGVIRSKSSLDLNIFGSEALSRIISVEAR